MTDAMAKIPDNWVYTEFGNIVEEVEKIQPRDEPEKEILYIDISSIDNSKFSIVAPKKYLGKEAPSRARQLVYTGDIVFSTVRTYLKNIAVVSEELSGQIASTGFCVIRPNDNIDKKLMFYLVQSSGFLTPLSKIQRGTSYPAVRDSDVFQREIPFPPKNEQIRIVSKLDELFTKLDAGMEELKNAKKQIKRYRQSVLKHAFNGNLTEKWREEHEYQLEPASDLLEKILKERREKWEVDYLAKLAAQGKKPKDDKWKKKYKEPIEPKIDISASLPTTWNTLSISQVTVDAKIGLDRPAAEQNKEFKGVPYIKMNNITLDGKVDLTDIVYVEVTSNEVEKFNIQNDDILFNTRNSRELVGKTGIAKNVQNSLIYNNNIMRIRTSQYFIPDILVYQICSPLFKPILERAKKGTTNVAAVYAKDLMPLPIIAMPLEEQEQIVSEIERHFSIADKAEQAIDQSLKQAERLRQSILKKAFEGHLVPQDPNDEPASDLLERIRAEKEKIKANKKTTRRKTASHRKKA